MLNRQLPIPILVRFLVCHILANIKRNEDLAGSSITDATYGEVLGHPNQLDRIFHVFYRQATDMNRMRSFS